MITHLLITGVGGDIGRDIVRCLKANRPALTLLGTDMDPYAAGSTLVNHFFPSPAARQEAEYLRFMKDIVKKNGVQVICPTTEIEIRFFDAHRKDFDGMLFLMQTPEVLAIAGDKYKTAQWLKSLGLPAPETFLPEDYRQTLPWPVIVKDRFGCGSHTTFRVENAAELAVFTKRVENPIIQSHVGHEKEEYTVGVFSDGKEIRDIQFRRTLGFGGLSRIAVQVQDSSLSDLMQKMAKALALRGAINVQLRKSGAEYVAFEINPRFSSTVYIRHHLGFTDVLWWLALLENKPTSYSPVRATKVAVRTVGEVFFETLP